MARAPDLAARAEELFARVLAPLVLGGALRPVRPMGARLSLALLAGYEPADVELASRVELSRVRRARTLLPLDTIEPPSGAEWALAAALSDLLQTSNEELPGPLARSRPAELLAEVTTTLQRIPPVRTLGEAVARHATFARVFELARADTTVRWWVGRQTFRGRKPPPRLLAWPTLRRVDVEAKRVGIAQLADTPGAIERAPYLEAFASWLEKTPLTDLATVGRADPRFAWNGANLALLAEPAGQTLALRAAADPLAGDPSWRPSDLARATAALAGRVDPSVVASVNAFVLALGEMTTGREAAGAPRR